MGQFIFNLNDSKASFSKDLSSASDKERFKFSKMIICNILVNGTLVLFIFEFPVMTVTSLSFPVHVNANFPCNINILRKSMTKT